MTESIRRNAAARGKRASLPCQVPVLERIPFDRAWERQKEAAARLKSDPVAPFALLLCEHEPVITLGRRGDRSELTLPEAELQRRGIAVRATSRGGKLTYHGPGQLVGYPIFDLRRLRLGIREYMRRLEAWLVEALREFGLEGAPAKLHTGVWVGEEKLASLGVHVSRGVTTHGWALNVSGELEPYQFIVPCGVPGMRMTSVSRVLGREVSLEEAVPAVLRALPIAFPEVTVRSRRL